MGMLLRGYKKNIKTVAPEKYIVQTQIEGDRVIEKKEVDVGSVHEVKVFREVKETLNRGLDVKEGVEKPVPCSPRLGPYQVMSVSSG